MDKLELGNEGRMERTGGLGTWEGWKPVCQRLMGKRKFKHTPSLLRSATPLKRGIINIKSNKNEPG
jgi:hypothetical protein